MGGRSYGSLALFAATVAAGPVKRDYNTSMIYSFEDVPITSNLQYIPCFDNFSCTNLEVPLDYEHPEVGTTNIAFIKHAASQQPAMGDIIFNPGGPGGSGVADVLVLTDALVALLGDTHNIVGMDPRGVNNSGPFLDCFNGNYAARDYFYYSSPLYQADPRDEVAISNFYELSGTWGTWCSRNLVDTAKYVNTPATAADMLRYAELLAESQGKPREEALVDYYGASYGTVLGATFASLYPNRVGKFLIDAVVDSEDYYFGNWSQNILQADASVDAFFEYCAKAGPACALYKNGSTTSDIKQRVDAILQDVEKNPIPVTDPNFVQVPTTVSHVDVRGLIMIAMYNPPALWPTLASRLLELEARNGSIVALSSQKGALPASECDNRSVKAESQTSKLVIACNDNNKHFDGSESSLVDLFKYDQELSSYFGELWAVVIVPVCRNLNTTPPENQLFPKFEKVKTRTPILFADNVLDPVTSSYDKMAAFYEDSVILKQDAVGHGLIVTTSKCTSDYVQQYFKTGELPPPNTICETDFAPFATSPSVKKRGLQQHHAFLPRWNTY